MNYELFENQASPEQVRMNYVQDDISIDKERVLENINEAFQNRSVITGICKKCDVKGNLIVDLGAGVKGIIERNEVSYIVESDGNVHKDRCAKKVGFPVECRVLSIDGDTILLSRKSVMEEYRDTYEKELKENMVVKGTVIGIQEYGAFIDIGGDITGMLPVADISWVFLKSPSEKMQIGDSVKLVVKSIKKQKGVLLPLLSRKELIPTWSNCDIFEQYNVGETVIGRIKNRIDTGIFVELDDSFEGLAEFVPNRRFKYGDPVTVKIEGISKERRKIKLKIM